ncbi:hypothetical protein CDAR_378591, partial [Caerostris darwini]
AKF